MKNVVIFAEGRFPICHLGANQFHVSKAKRPGSLRERVGLNKLLL